jgi:hypothetical protein
MQEEKMTEQESLRLIESMINTAKSQFSEDGHLYLLWGWLILFCSIGQFVLLHIFQSFWHWSVWLLTWIAVVYQYVYIKRKVRRRRVQTYADSIIGVVWLAFIIVLTLMAGVVGNIFQFQGKDFYLMINPLLLLIYGLPTFITGFILKFKPLWMGGIGCWVLSIVAAFVPGDWQVLMLAPAMLVAWIIPGYLLRARYRESFSNAAPPSHGL